MKQVPQATPEAAEDADLVEGARAGRKGAFGGLVERYYGLVASLAFVSVRDAVVAEEIAQETFIAAWRQLGELRRPEQLRAWLCSITRNICRNFKRDQHVRRRFQESRSPSGAEVVSSEPSALQRIISREEEGAALRALDQIPESYRVPLLLFYREGQSIERVAALLGLSENNIKKRLWRGRHILHERTLSLLESMLGAPEPRKAVVAAVLAVISVDAVGGAAGSGSPGPARSWMAKAALGAGLALVLGGGAYLAAAVRSPHSAGERPASPGGPSFAAPPKLAVVPTTPTGARGEGGELRSSSLSPRGRAPTSIFGFDFEDGNLPEAFSAGHVVPGPARPGNRFAVMGGIITWFAIPRTIVGFRTEKLAYRETLVLAFDYWMGSDAGAWMSLAVHNGDKNCTNGLSLKGAAHGRWAHATIRLSRLSPGARCRGARIEPGDALERMEIWGGAVGGAPFYVDNLRIVDYPPDALASAEDGLNVSVDQTSPEEEP